jgi:hypothetical protein
MINTQIKNSDFLPVKTPKYQAFIKTGFKFENIKREYDYIKGKLICICGKVETFQTKADNNLKKQGIDFFDRTIKTFIHDDEHLLEDGYTLKQIAEIREKYKQYLDNLCITSS